MRYPLPISVGFASDVPVVFLDNSNIKLEQLAVQTDFF